MLYSVKSFLFFAVVVKEYNSSFLTKGEEYNVLSVSVARLYHPYSILPYPLIFSPFSVLFFSACYVVSTCPYVIDRIQNTGLFFFLVMDICVKIHLAVTVKTLSDIA